MTEEIRDPEGLLAEYNRLKEDIKRISAERDELSKAKEALEESAKDSEWRNRALVAETKAALQSQGVKDVDNVLKHVKVDGLDFDDKGNLIGLDEKMKELRADLPSVFDPRVRVGGKGDIAPVTPSDAPVDPLRAGIRRAMHS